jgi:hypothetical protein
MSVAGSSFRERIVPVQIRGTLPQPLDGIIRKTLQQALEARPEAFVIELSWPHRSDLVVHIQEPFDKRLKFNRPIESELARELYATVTEVVEADFGPVKAS